MQGADLPPAFAYLPQGVDIMRHYGSRSPERIGRASASLVSASGAAPGVDVHGELSVLRTTMRRLGLVGLQVFDVWADGAEPDDLAWANDHVKPTLEALAKLPGGER